MQNPLLFVGYELLCYELLLKHSKNDLPLLPNLHIICVMILVGALLADMTGYISADKESG